MPGHFARFYYTNLSGPVLLNFVGPGPIGFDPSIPDQAYDYDYYMAKMDEMNKFEVHFKCIKDEEQTAEPTSEPTLDLTTLEPTTNSFYLNGLEQEYLNICLKEFSKNFERIRVLRRILNVRFNTKSVIQYCLSLIYSVIFGYDHRNDSFCISNESIMSHDGMTK